MSAAKNPGAYRSSPISESRRGKRRARRTKSEMEQIRVAMLQIVEAEHPMSVRQVFYRMVALNLIEKTEREYKGTVTRLLGELRKGGLMPYGWIADGTRWQRRPTTHDSLQDALDDAASSYRRGLWSGSPDYVEIWLEKEALAGVVASVTYEWDVPLMVTRGYPSLSYVHSAAEAIIANDKPTYIYYFGDHDPSGKDIPRSIEHQLNELGAGDRLTFQVVAVHENHIEELGLETRPTKMTDSRAKNWTGGSVELDAIPPATLRDMVWGCIEWHLDHVRLDKLRQVESEERETLQLFSAHWKKIREGYDLHD